MGKVNLRQSTIPYLEEDTELGQVRLNANNNKKNLNEECTIYLQFMAVLKIFHDLNI